LVSLALAATDAAFAQKPGGILKLGHFDSPASMSMLEESTQAVNRPVSGVLFSRRLVSDHSSAVGAAFANPEIYEFLEAEGIGYTIRLPANRLLQDKIGYLLKRPVGRPPHEVRRHSASLGLSGAELE
jgi:hypothetical protein